MKTPQSRLLPLLAIWVLAVVLLAGLVYWGSNSTGRLTGSKPLKTASPSERSSSKPSSRESAVSPVAPNLEPSTSETSSKPQLHGHDSSTASTLASTQSPLSDSSRPPDPPLPAPPAPLARVAIVIDDFGQDLGMAKRFLDVPLPITYSILPDQRYSREIAQLAHDHHREVFLHMPMEPHGYPKVKPGPKALLLSMSHEQLQKELRTLLDASPHLAGVNNHMGSRFTEHTESMKVVLQELAHRKLAFLDSFTSPQSVGYVLAGQFQLPSGKRDIFLDHNSSEPLIRDQIQRLIRKAKIEGTAIAIGHPRESTLRMLVQEAKRFEEEGIAVVPVTALMSTHPSPGGGESRKVSQAK